VRRAHERSGAEAASLELSSSLPCVLTINGGSSSIRFAVYEAGETLRRRLDGKIDRIGLSGTNFVVNDRAGKSLVRRRLVGVDEHTAARLLLDWLEAQPVFASVKAVGHRVVHGIKHSEPERVTPKLLAELHRITPYAPDHLPREIALIKAISRRHPELPQVACFDTAFHRSMPRVAKLLPISRRCGKGRRALRLPRPVLRLFDRGTQPPRSCVREGPCDPRASRQWRQPGRRAPWQKRRYQHGLHAYGRIGDEHPSVCHHAIPDGIGQSKTPAKARNSSTSAAAIV
jgi:hypothetical protein